MKNNNRHDFPYLPEGREILYVSKDNKFMREASEGLKNSGCAKQATSAVIVKDDEVVGRGTNAGERLDECPRDAAGFKTGEGYYLCKEHCDQKGHAEVMSIKDAIAKGFDAELKGADLYLDGHWWCCKNCWDAMIAVGIRNVYLRDDSRKLYEKK